MKQKQSLKDTEMIFAKTRVKPSLAESRLHEIALKKIPHKKSFGSVFAVSRLMRTESRIARELDCHA